ncbi:YqaJ viral recombinase family protein [Thiococcus pfennigii]|uniref:YqaJ viral recombinase family nuclease n=1 Tax=Thiococcus pfennigii TaxID=1057 RepID=UPI001908C3F0|nr:YqaJ viral recombinase family protein [Thiococcus pfennigii]MBK1699944.1 endonuclease [Thiococcus pfennigii]
MKIIDVTQRSAEWKAWRARGVTASEAAIVLGRSPYKTPWRLWAERTGLAREEDLSANPHVQRGVAQEDSARQAFEARHGTLLLPLCAESDAHPVLRASFDGIADDGAPVELKVPSARTFAEVAAQQTEAPAFQLYWPQVQHQLFVAEAERGWLVFYGGTDRLLEFPVARDAAFLDQELVPRCLAFWEAIAQRQEPPRDPARDLYVPDGEALDHWVILAGDYRDRRREKACLEARLKESKEELDRLEAALVAMMGDFLTAEAAGLKVTRFQQNGAIDYGQALRALRPDLEAAALETYRRQPTERVRITALEDG